MVAELVLNGTKFPLVAESLLPSGRRSWTRRIRPTQQTDPRIQKTVRWIPYGPFGLSIEGAEGELAQDYNDNCETRYDGLLTVAAKQESVDLSTADPEEGAMTLPFTMPASLGGFETRDTSGIIQDRDFLVFGRGQAITLVDPTDMNVIATYPKSGFVAGMTVWKNHGVISYGSQADIEKIGDIGESGATFATVAERAKAMTVGPDRWWGVKASSDSTDDNKVFYTLDDLVAFSNVFQVGDDKIPATGLGTSGPYLAVGSEVGAHSFTDLGKSQRLLETVKDFRSENNGTSIDSLWGWTYITTELGLFAVPLPSLIANPVGTESLTSFDGPIDGYPTAVRAWKDSLWAAYLTTEGHTYILRGMFGPETPATGRPTWYPFAKIENTECHVIRGTSSRTNPTLIVGTDSDAVFFTLGRRGRDISDDNYRFSTGGGEWYGTTMMREPGMHKNIRYFVVFTEDCSATKTFRIDVSLDGDSYVTVGTVSDSGHQFVRPSSGGVPLDTVNGHTIKPRIVIANDSETTPPRLIGPIEMVYDERPDTVEEHAFQVQLEVYPTKWDALTELLTAHGDASSPIAFTAPGETTTRYGFVTGVEEMKDIKGDSIRAANVTVQEWSV